MYQWQINYNTGWENLIDQSTTNATFQGSKTHSLSIQPVAGSQNLNNTQYKCILTNDDNTVESNIVTLTIKLQTFIKP